MHNILLHDVNAFGWNALHFAAKGGNLNVRDRKSIGPKHNFG